MFFWNIKAAKSEGPGFANGINRKYMIFISLSCVRGHAFFGKRSGRNAEGVLIFRQIKVHRFHP